MLSKVKQLNYALAGEPDYKKAAALLHESLEYKIWSWENQKCLVFQKQDLEPGFKSLQQNLVIKQIVPFEMFTDTDTQRDLVIATYTYHLEAKDTSSSQKFIWLNTCAYAFDQDANIVKVSQQGELYPEGEVSIAFEVFPREELQKKIEEFFKCLLSDFDILYNDFIQSDIEIYRIIGPPGPGKMGDISGLSNIVKFISGRPDTIEWVKPVDIYIDQDSPGYESAIIFVCGQAVFPLRGKDFEAISMICPMRPNLEKGKFSKVFQIFSATLVPISSPFDDINFSAPNFMKS